MIGQVITNLNTVLGSLGGQSKQFAKAVDSLSELVDGLEARKQDISNGVAYANAASASVADLLAQARPPIKKVVHETDRTAQTIVDDRDYFDNFLNSWPDALQIINRLGLYGDFSVSTSAMSCSSSTARAVSPCMSSWSASPAGGARHDENLLRAQPDCRGPHRNRRDAGADAVVPQLRQAAVFNKGKTYSAYFAEAGGLTTDNPVQVSGFRVGQVSSIELDGPRVLVKFHVAKNVHLGDRTEAAVKMKSPLGAKVLEVTPRGEGELSGPIPLDRTTPAYQVPDALGI